MKLSLQLAAVCLMSLFLGAAASAADTPAKPAYCATPEHRQFDFWIGDWDAYDMDEPDKVQARAHVDSTLNGCVLFEDYQQIDGLHGQSFNLYDASRKVWHESWVTNGGSMMSIEGNMKDGAMVLSGSMIKNGHEVLIRDTWTVGNGIVRETAVKSTDGGKTWETLFDMGFRKHKETASLEQDQKTVGDLDKKFQAAVKTNDAAGMESILDDNFVLVTGRGKTYTKADLLNDARNKREVFEHQEDTDQTVRVFGETAIVTAKLWEKGAAEGKDFDYTVWFSDTYVRTAAGWKYVFGQSSLPLPKSQSVSPVKAGWIRFRGAFPTFNWD